MVGTEEASAFIDILDEYGRETQGPCCTTTAFCFDIRDTPHSVWNLLAAKVYREFCVASWFGLDAGGDCLYY
jgi:hypothetical protein